MEQSGAVAVRVAVPDSSYYNRKGLLGFIFRKASSGEEDDEDEVEQQEEEEEEEEEEEQEQEEEQQVDEKEEKDDEMLHLEMKEEEEEGEDVEEIRYQLEMKKLVKAIRKLQGAKGEPMDKKVVFNVLMKSDKLREMITSPSEVRLHPLKPHPLGAELRKAIAYRKAKRDQYRLACEEQDRQMASYRVQRVASLQPSEESEALLPLLPAEQQQALSQPAASNPNFAENIQESWSVSDSIAQVCTARLKGIEENLLQVKQHHKQDLSSSSNEETPRTIFKAFKSQS